MKRYSILAYALIAHISFATGPQEKTHPIYDFYETTKESIIDYTVSKIISDQSVYAESSEDIQANWQKYADIANRTLNIKFVNYLKKNNKNIQDYQYLTTTITPEELQYATDQYLKTSSMYKLEKNVSSGLTHLSNKTSEYGKKGLEETKKIANNLEKNVSSGLTHLSNKTSEYGKKGLEETKKIANKLEKNVSSGLTHLSNKTSEYGRKGLEETKKIANKILSETTKKILEIGPSVQKIAEQISEKASKYLEKKPNLGEVVGDLTQFDFSSLNNFFMGELIAAPTTTIATYQFGIVSANPKNNQIRVQIGLLSETVPLKNLKKIKSELSEISSNDFLKKFSFDKNNAFNFGELVAIKSEHKNVLGILEKTSNNGKYSISYKKNDKEYTSDRFPEDIGKIKPQFITSFVEKNYDTLTENIILNIGDAIVIPTYKYRIAEIIAINGKMITFSAFGKTATLPKEKIGKYEPELAISKINSEATRLSIGKEGMGHIEMQDIDLSSDKKELDEEATRLSIGEEGVGPIEIQDAEEFEKLLNDQQQKAKTDSTKINDIINKFPERFNEKFVSNFRKKEESEQAKIVADFNQRISELENILSEELKKDHVSEMVGHDLALIAKMYLKITSLTDDYEKAEEFAKKVKEFRKTGLPHLVEDVDPDLVEDFDLDLFLKKNGPSQND